jgi:hypothetical protein
MEACETRDLLRLVCLGVKAGGGGAAVEVAGEDWLEEGAEDDLGTAREKVSKCIEKQQIGEITQSGEEPSRERGQT